MEGGSGEELSGKQLLEEGAAINSMSHSFCGGHFLTAFIKANLIIWAHNQILDGSGSLHSLHALSNHALKWEETTAGHQQEAAMAALIAEQRRTKQDVGGSGPAAGKTWRDSPHPCCK